MDCGGQWHPEVRVGGKIVFGAERKEIDIVHIRILVFILVEVRAQQEPLASTLEGDLSWEIVKLPVLDGNPLGHRRDSGSCEAVRAQVDLGGMSLPAFGTGLAIPSRGKAGCGPSAT